MIHDACETAMSGQKPPPNLPPASRWQNFEKESAEDRRIRYSAIFSRLDVNKDGTVCIGDLTEALKAMGSKDPSHAEV